MDEDRGQAYRALMRRYPTGVTVVTTRVGDHDHGMTANSVTTLSLDPPLMLICVWKEARAHDLLERSGVFVVNLLAHDQGEVSRVFAVRDVPDEERWAAVTTRPSTLGPLRIDGATGYVECRIVDRFPGGTHTIFVGEVVELAEGVDADPLVFHGGTYRALSPEG